SLADRPMLQGGYIQSSIPALDSARVMETVKALSANKNRYYRSNYGVAAAKWIADQFKVLSQGRNDVTVDLFKHSFEQPSVIADDNASGVATVLEVYRVLLQTGFKNDRTLMFMTYAGEEVGLLGSQDIANLFREKGKSVVAVMQLDMTAFPGAGNKVVFMTDFVSADLTRFSQKLMDTYVKTPWATDRCGYACSDHASWTKAGFPSVMPFEATMSTDNKDIHTTRDLVGFRGP
ncbi:M28 family peptidase, partial [bacterium]|nr:M28 family peptidase [bacterium]